MPTWERMAVATRSCHCCRRASLPFTGSNTSGARLLANAPSSPLHLCGQDRGLAFVKHGAAQFGKILNQQNHFVAYLLVAYPTLLNNPQPQYTVRAVSGPETFESRFTHCITQQAHVCGGASVIKMTTMPQNIECCITTCTHSGLSGADNQNSMLPQLGKACE